MQRSITLPVLPRPYASLLVNNNPAPTCCSSNSHHHLLHHTFSTLSSLRVFPSEVLSPRCCSCKPRCCVSGKGTCSCCRQSLSSSSSSQPRSSCTSYTRFTTFRSASIYRFFLSSPSLPFSKTSTTAAGAAAAKRNITMTTTEYKLKDLTSFKDIPNLEKVESGVEGIEGGKVLVVRVNDKIHAISPKCTHYGAPLKLGVVAPDGRITCAWHGACFTIATGEIEDAPAPNHLNTFEVYERDGAVYIKGEEKAIRAGQRDPNLICTSTSQDKVVVIGGGSGSLGTVQTLRELKFKGSVTLLTKEPNLPLDRTKLSKALIPDSKKLEIRPAEWYKNAGIDIVNDVVTGVDFKAKTVSTESGKSYPYTKLVLATGGIPRSLPLEGFKDLGNIFVLRDVTDVQAILGALGEQKKKVVIVGTSFIGMEVGNALSKNHDVSIIGMEKAPLERVMGEQVGKIFQTNLEKSGVKFYLNASVDKATPSPSNQTKVGAVRLKDGTSLDADVVILGVGVRPATDFLQNNPDVTLEKDGSLRTDESFAVTGLGGDVYAVGDIATYPYHGPGAPSEGVPVRIEHWNIAQNAGRTAARSINHATTTTTSSSTSPFKPKQFIPIFWSSLGQQLRYCGNTTVGWDSLVLKGKPENSKFAAYYCKGETVVAVATMGVDPIMVKSAELMRRGHMPSKKEIEADVDLLKIDVPAHIAI